MILIVSAPADDHATAVRRRLDARGGEAVMVDLSEFPQRASLTFEVAHRAHEVHYASESVPAVDLRACHVAWWRRPQPLRLHDEVADGADRQFAFNESYAAITGAWLTLPSVWVNHPTRDDEASKKLYQLSTAGELGFDVPDTCITNDPGRAKAFVRGHSGTGVVYKAFSATETAWRETRLLTAQEEEGLDSVRFAPVIFQEYVPAGTDLRITVIADQVFACGFSTGGTSYPYDYRMVMDEAAPHAVELPGALRSRIVEYVRRLGLVYGAIDMRLTPEGKYVFLEINPSGQWLFAEMYAGHKITEALVDFMLEHDTPGRGHGPA